MSYELRCTGKTAQAPTRPTEVVRTRTLQEKEKKKNPRRSQGQLSEVLIFTNLIINEYHVSGKTVKRIIVFQGLENR
jgi:hypothetical protein